MLRERFAVDFADDTLFERDSLSRVFPLIRADSKASTVDIRLGSTRRSFGVFPVEILGRSDESIIHDWGLRPLLFGSAWKVLDLLVEHVLLQRPGARAKPTIKSKLDAAAVDTIQIFPLSQFPHLLDRVLAAYICANQYRHSLVHRRVTVKPNGEFVGQDTASANLRGLSPVEQSAFARMAQRVADAVIRGEMSPRQERQLGADLDMLTNLTSLPSLNYLANSMPTPIVRVTIECGDEVNMTALKQTGANCFSDATDIDVQFIFDDELGVQFTGALNDAPDITLRINRETNESWLQRV